MLTPEQVTQLAILHRNSVNKARNCQVTKSIDQRLVAECAYGEAEKAFLDYLCELQS